MRNLLKLIRWMLLGLVRSHRAGFRCFWRWKSRRRAGRPSITPEIRRLIRQMSLANPLWGAPRIQGELLKLGIDIGQTSVAKYMAPRRRPRSFSGTPKRFGGQIWYGVSRRKIRETNFSFRS